MSAGRSDALTGGGNYFEDFTPGQLIRHARGKTIEALENVLFTNLTLNTAQLHFNEDGQKQTDAGQRVSFGGANFSIVMGLASEDCCENALAELGLDKIKLPRSVFHGDTLYAYSEVLETKEAGADAGEVRFRHWGVNQHGQVVFEGERRVLIKRRAGGGRR